MGAQLDPLGLAGRTNIYSHSNFTTQTYAQDTFVSTDDGTNTPLLSGGTFLLSMYAAGGPYYSETWSGVMQWYPYTTNGNFANDIYMTGMGHSNNGASIYARTLRRAGSNKAGIQVWFSGSGSTITLNIYALKLSNS